MVLQGMGDDFPVGYSLNNGGGGFGWGNWGSWFGGSGNPFMDIFAVTMANFRFTGGGSMWNGMFSGGGMNAGFTASPWGGADYSFSTGSGSTSTSVKKTPEEKKAETLEKKKLGAKHKALISLLEKYLETLKNSDKVAYDSLEYDLHNNGGYKKVTQENYDKLKEYYTTNKDKIKTALQKTDEWKKNVELNIGDSVGGIKIAGTSAATFLNGDSLKSDIDVMELMESLSTSSRSWFHLENPADSVKKINKAIYNALKKKISDLKSGSSYSSLSQTTKDMLDKAYSHAASSEGNDTNFGCLKDTETKIESACAQMYYWLRVANAEIYSNEYACLSEDFADDALLGKNAIVNLARKDLHSSEHYKDGGVKYRKTDATANNTWKVKYDGS